MRKNDGSHDRGLRDLCRQSPDGADFTLDFIYHKLITLMNEFFPEAFHPSAFDPDAVNPEGTIDPFKYANYLLDCVRNTSIEELLDQYREPPTFEDDLLAISGVKLDPTLAINFRLVVRYALDAGQAFSQNDLLDGIEAVSEANDILGHLNSVHNTIESLRQFVDRSRQELNTEAEKLLGMEASVPIIDAMWD